MITDSDEAIRMLRASFVNGEIELDEFERRVWRAMNGLHDRLDRPEWASLAVEQMFRAHVSPQFRAEHE